MTPVRVLLVDDDDLMRAGLKAVISSDPSVKVVGEAGNGRAAVEQVRALRPDLVLMDVRMPGLGGVAATNRIKAAHPATVVALISTTSPEDLGPEIAESDADALIWKRDLRPRVLEDLWRHRRAG